MKKLLILFLLQGCFLLPFEAPQHEHITFYNDYYDDLYVESVNVTNNMLLS